MKEEWKRLIGQRLAVGFDGFTVPEEYIRLVKEYQVGNVILFRRNVKDYDQLRALCESLRRLITEETGLEPYIMIDEECGSVSRLAHIAAQTPSAMAIGATGKTENAYQIGRLIGEELKAVGVNFNLAPVLDVLTNPAAAHGNRCFGTEPEQVAAFGCEYVRGLQETGVLACGKHFPGHGDTVVDSHLGLPVVEKTQEEVRRVELTPFRAAVNSGLKGIMSAHVVFPAFEPERVPATVSRRVMTGLVREELGFRGILLSDGMEMNAVMDMFGMEEGVRRALAAGIDIALVCHSAKQAASSCEYLYQALEQGNLNEEETKARFAHIAQIKKNLPLQAGEKALFGNEAQRALGRRIMAEAVSVTFAPEGKPLPKAEGAAFLGVNARAVTFASDDVPLDAAAVCAQKYHGIHASLEGPLPENVKTAVVFLNKHPDNEKAVQAACRLAEAGAQVIAVGMSAPQCMKGLPDSAWQIMAWQYDTLALDAVMKLFEQGE